MSDMTTKGMTGMPAFLVRFIPALLIISALFYGFGAFYTRMVLPVFAFEMELFHPEYEVLSYGTEKTRTEGNSMYYIVKINRATINKGGIPKYGKTVKLNTVASVLYIQPIIVLSLLLSWPGFSLKERGSGILISFPLMLAAASIDIPVFFISQIEQGFPVGSPSEQIRIMLNNFLSNGGRQFLALLVVLVTIGLISIMKSPRVDLNIPPNDPCPCGSGKKYKQCCMNR